MQFKQILFNQEYADKYWDGPTNRFARYYTYFQRCLGLLNEAKYLLGLIGLGFWKSDIVIHWWMLVGGIIMGLPIMIFIGRWHLQKVQKATDYVNTLYGSITGFGSYNMQVIQTNFLEAIAKKLGVDTEKLKEELNK